MRNKVGIVIVVALVALAAAQFIVWRGAHPSRSRRRPGFVSGGIQRDRQLRPDQRNSLFGFGPLNISLESRLISTLAQQVGPFTISARNIRAVSDDRLLVRPLPMEERPMGQFYLYLQLLGSDEDLGRCRLERDSVTATDDTGRTIGPVNLRGENLPPVRFKGGIVHTLRLDAPADTAHSLLMVEGRLAFGPAGSTPVVRPFRITNVPLPNAPRLFGRAVPLTGGTAAWSKLPAGLVVKTGGEAEAMLREFQPVRSQEGLKPQRLLIGAGRPVKLGVPSADDPSPVEIGADLGQSGFLKLSIANGGQNWSGDVWDSETMFAALPATNGAMRRAVALRLSRNFQLTDAYSTPSQTFPSANGSPGGAIHSPVRVDGKGFGQGAISVVIQQREGNGWSREKRTFLRIGHDGSFTIPNLAAGEYRLQRPASELLPNAILGQPTLSLTEYIKYRFGKDVTQGAWSGQDTVGLYVRPGRKTEAPPLAWIPTKRAASALTKG